MNFEETVAHYHILHACKEGIALWNIHGEMNRNADAPEINTHSLLFVIDGKMEVNIQGRTYTLTRGCIADVVGHALSPRLLSASPDVQAYMLLLTEEYLSGLFKHTPPFPLSYAMDIMEKPVYAVEETILAPVIHCLHDLEQSMAYPLLHFQDSLLKCRMWTLFLQMADFLVQKTEETAEKEQESDRKKMLFAQFVKLVHNYICTEHTVNFYASQLNITPQYLRRIVKECSGRSVSLWINENLTREIVKLLTTTDLSIQNIADELNFSDQAVLTKFFKRQKGMSPLQYRNTYE